MISKSYLNNLSTTTFRKPGTFCSCVPLRLLEILSCRSVYSLVPAGQGGAASHNVACLLPLFLAEGGGVPPTTLPASFHSP